MLLLFTSADSKHPLYKRDLLNVCCEPSGAQIQFSYRKKWISEEVGETKTLSGQPTLVVFCERISNESPYYLYHPIRLGQVVKAYDEFGSINVAFELGGFFNYDKYQHTRTSLINEFQNYIKEGGSYPGKTPYKWLRKEAELTQEPNDGCLLSLSDFTEDSWQPLVRYVGSLTDLKSSVFFSVQKRDTFGGPPTFIFEPKPSYVSGRATYELKGGKSHKIILYVISGKEARYQTPQLLVSNSVASVSGPFLRQRSSDIEADFELFLKRSFQLETGMLELNVPRDPSQSDKVQSPELQVLVRVGVPWRILLFAVICLTIGGIFAVISPGVIDEVAVLLRPNWCSWLLSNKLLVFSLTKVVAFVTLGVGTFLGFNKLPFKGS